MGGRSKKKLMDNTVMGEMTVGNQVYEGFVLDNMLETDNEKIHFNLYVPDTYDGTEDYALFVTLPGWEGLYFQGVGTNLRFEKFGQEAVKYNKNMIVVAPQLDDWEDTSAEQTIKLVEYFLDAYRIDHSKIYINGYSGGGETLSLVLEKRPELFAAALHVSSKWDGSDYSKMIKNKTPLYFAIGESDSYYGSDPVKKAYKELKSKYEETGLSEEEINKVLVLDVKEQEYFTARGYTDQHGGGMAFAHDETIMKWLFNH